MHEAVNINWRAVFHSNLCNSSDEALLVRLSESSHVRVDPPVTAAMGEEQQPLRRGR